MINSRPHILKFKTTGSPAYQDGDFNMVPGLPGEEIILPCRYEPNSGAKVIKGPDGTNVLYNGIIYLDKAHAALTYGLPVNAYDGPDLLASGSVIRFAKGQMNCRLWV